MCHYGGNSCDKLPYVFTFHPNQLIVQTYGNLTILKLMAVHHLELVKISVFVIFPLFTLFRRYGTKFEENWSMYY